MDKRSLLVLAGICALTIGGCGTEDSTTSSPTSSPVASTSPVAATPFAAKPLVAEKLKNGKVAGKEANTRIPGLVPSTDSNQRAREVQAGINSKKNAKDPFASLPPVITFKTPSGGSGSTIQRDPGATTNPGTFTPPARRPSAVPNFPKPNRGNTPSTATTTRPSAQPNPAATIPSLPPLPEPTLARAVEVTGVVVVAGVPQAIVKAPNEATSRYVQAGQRLSNGQVLVKRIEVSTGGEPIVVLEQNGVEVSRTVGEKATPTTGNATPVG
jgi:hypothetical protein